MKFDGILSDIPGQPKGIFVNRAGYHGGEEFRSESGHRYTPANRGQESTSHPDIFVIGWTYYNAAENTCVSLGAKGAARTGNELCD